MTKKPDFKGFGKASQKKTTSKTSGQIVTPTGYRHLQVRLATADAIRFRRGAEDRGMNLQSALVEAVNALLSNWGEPPAVDLGSAGKSSPE